MPLGSTVFIEGYGYAICDDIGGSIKGNIIDVGVDTLNQAYQWGYKEDVLVYVI
ncbi:MAG: 3D domain-containing protein [Dialister micraerophilus]|nr:3D domain-containing protein [Dialister micraerophilus]